PPANEDTGSSSEEDDNVDSWSNLSRNLSKHIQWPMKTLARRSHMVEQLVAELLQVCQRRLSKTFFPELQPAIGVGGAFEGWSPNEEEAEYYMLVPLKPPRGHSFHLELGETGIALVKDSHIRVELDCTCTEEDILCFVHTSKDDLQRYQAPSLLHTLCTDSYLHVQRTASWFQDIVKSAWAAVPQSLHYSLQMIPSRWFCRMLLTSESGRSLSVVILFGVQQDNSDIYLSSLSVDPYAPGTTWPQTCAVAEAKFFHFMARNIHPRNVHLQCLHLCTCILDGTVITACTMKNVVMHLLQHSWLQQDLPVWRRRDFVELLLNIMSFLLCCLENKHLVHFFLGNDSLPEEIILPLAFRRSKTVNIFQHLQDHPPTNTAALRAFN
ncbi:IPIL1 protein, partial [Rhinopomastus cyanomelas]|nr:IPIL1 protein [Rhinopomastus cyanomelas]